MSQKVEQWALEVGPVTSDRLDGFVDVRYSIRYPRGTFEVRQRVRDSADGYSEAHARIERIMASHAPSDDWPYIREQFRIEFGVEMETRYGGEIMNLMMSIRELLKKDSQAPSEPVLPQIVLDSPICDICGHHTLDARFHHAPGSQGNMQAGNPSEAAEQPTLSIQEHDFGGEGEY